MWLQQDEEMVLAACDWRCFFSVSLWRTDRDQSPGLSLCVLYKLAPVYELQLDLGSSCVITCSAHIRLSNE